ncbi:hypothetical protein [Treponema sp. R80B11-R83G3]
MSLLLQFICGILIMGLSLTVYFMLRYMRKHPPRTDNGTQKA